MYEVIPDADVEFDGKKYKGCLVEISYQVGIDPQDLIHLGDGRYSYKGMIGTVSEEEFIQEKKDARPIQA